MIADDPVTAEQARVIELMSRVDRFISGIIRYGRPRASEIDENTALAMIEGVFRGCD